MFEFEASSYVFVHDDTLSVYVTFVSLNGHPVRDRLTDERIIEVALDQAREAFPDLWPTKPPVVVDKPWDRDKAVVEIVGTFTMPD